MVLLLGISQTLGLNTRFHKQFFSATSMLNVENLWMYCIKHRFSGQSVMLYLSLQLFIFVRNNALLEGYLSKYVCLYKRV